MLVRNQKGQGLVEYLILVALMAVATMGVVTLLSHSVRGKFVQIVDAIQGRPSSRVRFDAPNESDYKKKDMSSFMQGAASREK